MEVQFLDSIIEVNTADEFLLFRSILDTKDVAQFKMGGVYVSTKWDAVSVDITVIDGNRKYTRHIEDPRVLDVKISKMVNFDLLEYGEYGEYSYISNRGYLVVAQGGHKVEMLIDDAGTAKDAKYSAMPNKPDIKHTGVDENHAQYDIKFPNPGGFRFFYNASHPLDSYFERI